MRKPSWLVPVPSSQVFFDSNSKLTLGPTSEFDVPTPSLFAGAYLAEHLPMGRLVPFPNLGHAPFLSRPAEVLEKWREFLQ